MFMKAFSKPQVTVEEAIRNMFVPLWGLFHDNLVDNFLLVEWIVWEITGTYAMAVMLRRDIIMPWECETMFMVYFESAFMIVF